TGPPRRPGTRPPPPRRGDAVGTGPRAPSRGGLQVAPAQHTRSSSPSRSETGGAGTSRGTRPHPPRCAASRSSEPPSPRLLRRACEYTDSRRSAYSHASHDIPPRQSAYHKASHVISAASGEPTARSIMDPMNPASDDPLLTLLQKGLGHELPNRLIAIQGF